MSRVVAAKGCVGHHVTHAHMSVSTPAAPPAEHPCFCCNELHAATNNRRHPNPASAVGVILCDDAVWQWPACVCNELRGGMLAGKRQETGRGRIQPHARGRPGTLVQSSQASERERESEASGCSDAHPSRQSTCADDEGYSRGIGDEGYAKAGGRQRCCSLSASPCCCAPPPPRQNPPTNLECRSCTRRRTRSRRGT